MSASGSAHHRRRPQWRGERKAVLVRMPVDVAEDLTRGAESQQCSVSEHAAELLAQALARPAGPGEAGCWWGSGASSPAVGSRQEVGVVTGPGKRLVTVLVTLAVPAEADAEDAAGLVVDAAVSTALEVVCAAGVEGHLPVPGSLVVRRGGGQPWRVVAVSKEFATLTDLSGAVVRTPLSRLAPDPLDAIGEGTQAGVQRGQWRQNC